jgi:hypothetical protein
MEEIKRKLSCLPTATTEAELRHKIELQNEQLELQNKQISSLLQSMKQEREERRQKGEQREQRLALAITRMEIQLRQSKSHI